MAAGVTAALPASLAGLMPDHSTGRPSPSDRFSSPAIEAVIAGMTRQIADPMLSAMFERCFPNTPRELQFQLVEISGGRSRPEVAQSLKEFCVLLLDGVP